MTVGFRQTSNLPNSGTGNGSSLTVTLPSPAQAGSLLVFTVGSYLGTTFTNYAGFNTVLYGPSAAYNGSNTQIEMRYKFAAGGETSFTFTRSANCYWDGVVAEYTGVSANTPILSSASSTVGTPTNTAPALASAAAPGLLIHQWWFSGSLGLGSTVTGFNSGEVEEWHYNDVAVSGATGYNNWSSAGTPVAYGAACPASTPTFYQSNNSTPTTAQIANSFLLNGNNPPNAPTITSPGTGSTLSTLTPTITSTATDPENNTLTITTQVSTVSNFSTVAYTNTGSSIPSGGSSSYTTPTLTAQTVYYARAFATDQYGAQGPYSSTVQFTPDQAPNAPTALSPAGSTSTYNAGFTASWTNNFSTSPQTQGSYAFQRVSSAYGTQWWNGSAWVGSETYVTSSSASVVFPSGQWLGSAAYTWSVRIADSLGNAGPYSSTVTITSDSAPLAPTLVSPANNSYLNLGAGFTSSWTYNTGDAINDAQGSYAFRMKISGAGAYSYWNAGTQVFQSTLVWNTSVSSSVTFPAGAFTNGNVYNYSAATGDTLGTQGPFATDFVTTATPPPTVTVTAPNGVAGDQQPYVIWTETPASGQSYTGYRVVVESGSYGTIPGSGTSAYDSGVVATSSVVQQQITSSLINGTAYRVFVQVTQTGGVTSTWSTLNFTVTLDAPAAPVVTATMDVTNYRVALTVQGRDNALSANAASIETDTSAWAAGTNTTAARSTAQSRDGSASMSLTATAGGAISASTASGTAGIRVN